MKVRYPTRGRVSTQAVDHCRRMFGLVAIGTKGKPWRAPEPQEWLSFSKASAIVSTVAEPGGQRLLALGSLEG